MAIDEDVQVIENAINFRSKYFTKESKKIEKQNELTHKAIIQSYPRRDVIYDTQF